MTPALAELSRTPPADGRAAPRGTSQVPRSLLYSDSHGDLAVVLWSTYEALMAPQLGGGKVATKARRGVVAGWFGTSITAVDDARRELLADVAGGPFLSRSSNPGHSRSVRHAALRLPRDTRERDVAVPNWTRDLVWAGKRRPAGRISPGAWRLCAAVLDKATRDTKKRDVAAFDVTVERLGAVLGCSASTARRRLAELERVGMVEVAARPGGWLRVRPITDAAEAEQVAKAFAEDGRKAIPPRRVPFHIPALTPAAKRHSPLPGSGTAQGSPTQEPPSTDSSGLPVFDSHPEVDAPAREATAGTLTTLRKARPRPRRPQRRVPAAAAAVYRALPATLTERVPEHGSRRALEVIAAELAHRTPAELAERITRNWEHFQYRITTSEPIRDPVAVAIRLTRRGIDCPDVRCEDGWQLDLEAPCKASEDHSAALTSPQGPQDAAAPLAATTPADSAPCAWAPPSEAQESTRLVITPAPDAVPAEDVPGYAALARALLNVHTDAERDEVLARHARTA